MAAEIEAPNLRACAFVCLGRVLALTGPEANAYAARANAVELYEAKGNVAAAAQTREAALSSGAPA